MPRGNNEGSIYQIKSGPHKGKWAAATPRNSSTPYVVRMRDTRDEAARELRRLMAEIDAGRSVKDERYTLREFLESWLENEVRPNVKPRTLDQYSNSVNKWIIPRLGKIPLKTLKSQQVSDFMRYLESQGLAPSSRGSIRATLNRAMRVAMDWDYIVKNPVQFVAPPRVMNDEIVPFTPDEVTVLIDAAESSPYSALYTLAVVLGPRQGELLGLRWRDVDFESKSINIRTTLVRSVGKTYLGEPKTKGSKRRLPCPPLVMKRLREHRDRQQAQRKLAGPLWTDMDLVFPHHTGRWLNSGLLFTDYKALLEGAKLPEKRFHDLRHTAASIMIADKMPIKLVSMLLGHADIMITQRIYGHLYDFQIEESIHRLEARYGV